MAEGTVASYSDNVVWFTSTSAHTIAFAPVTNNGYYYASWDNPYVDPDMEMDIGL